MTGPEHYRAAQDILTRLKRSDYEGTDVPNLLAAAQVHATLAQAAATLDATRINPEGWMAVLDADNT